MAFHNCLEKILPKDWPMALKILEFICVVIERHKDEYPEKEIKYCSVKAFHQASILYASEVESERTRHCKRWMWMSLHLADLRAASLPSGSELYQDILNLVHDLIPEGIDDQDFVEIEKGLRERVETQTESEDVVMADEVEPEDPNEANKRQAEEEVQISKMMRSSYFC